MPIPLEPKNLSHNEKAWPFLEKPEYSLCENDT